LFLLSGSEALIWKSFFDFKERFLTLFWLSQLRVWRFFDSHERDNILFCGELLYFAYITTVSGKLVRFGMNLNQERVMAIE
jgi:hypothetical protein